MADLISRSALMAKLEINEDCMKCIHANGPLCKLCAADACEAICDAPTIEAEPTKHGRWEKDGARMMFGNMPVKCSQCGFKTLQDALHKMDYHYCPNCGAKMDEVEHG